MDEDNDIRFGQDYSDYNEREYGVAQKITADDAGEVAMRKTDGLEEMFEPDWKLACIFQSFLTGKIDGIPTFQYMDRAFKESQELDPSGNIISEAYGLVVEKDCTLDLSEKMTKDLERHDVITPEEHYGYIIRETSRAKKDIDVEKYPRIDKKRVKHVQKFLKEYVEHKSKEQEGRSK